MLIIINVCFMHHQKIRDSLPQNNIYISGFSMLIKFMLCLLHWTHSKLLKNPCTFWLHQRAMLEPLVCLVDKEPIAPSFSNGMILGPLVHSNNSGLLLNGYSQSMHFLGEKKKLSFRIRFPWKVNLINNVQRKEVLIVHLLVLIFYAICICLNKFVFVK